MKSILEVDLSTKEIKKTKVPDEIYYNVLSGKGLGAWYCLKHIPAGADPLGPDNILGFTSGALTGTGALLCGRWTVVGKSPLTGGWGDANCGGFFSPAIKQCGVDAIFFRGISETPVYLFMDGKACELRDASAYWGLDATEAEQRLTEDNTVKKKPRVAVIGQAGERLSRIAGICNDGGRIAARSGLGAVMGSKRLKAVVLAGSLPIRCAAPEQVKELSRALGRKIKKAPSMGFLKGHMLTSVGQFMGLPISFPMDGFMSVMLLKKWGTSMNQPLGIVSGDSPLKNWSGGPRDVRGAIREYNPDKALSIQTAKYHCYACPLGCGGILDTRGVNGGAFDETHKPEYETINQFGPLLKNRSYDSIYYINELLNRAGMDSISAGATVAFAIEAFEAGILTKEDTGGLELTWGNTEAIIALVKQMIAREGFGDVLADGSRIAAQRIGKGSEAFAMQTGGSELPAHDPKTDACLGVHYAAEPAPGKHTVATDLMYNAMSLCDVCSWAPPAKLRLMKETFKPTETAALSTAANICYTMVVDGAGGCYYGEMMGVHTFKLIPYLNAASGWDRTGDDYMEVGKRIQAMRQMFNIKHGIDPQAVRLPGRVLGYPPLKKGPLKGVQAPHADEQIRMHWEALGWDRETGAPTQETVDALGINALLEMEI